MMTPIKRLSVKNDPKMMKRTKYKYMNGLFSSCGCLSSYNIIMIHAPTVSIKHSQYVPYAVGQKNCILFIFFNNFVKSCSVLIILAHIYLNEFATKQ